MSNLLSGNKKFINIRNIALLGSLFVIIGIVIFLVITPKTTLDKENLKLTSGDKEYSLKVEVANTPSSQEKGLMDRKEMAENHGMLFVFSDPRMQSFWMKNTYIPLDMLFFDAQGKLVNIVHSAQPCIDQENNCPSYVSTGPAKYVLELNGGWAKKNNIGTDAQIDLATFRQ